MSKFIVMEGLDFVGKSTLANCLVEEIGGIVYKTPPKAYIPKIKCLDKGDLKFTEERFLTFMEGMRVAFAEVKSLLKKGNNVIADRWVWTTLAYHFAANQTLYSKWGEKWRKLIPDFYQSGLSLLIYVDQSDVNSKRIEMRKKLTKSDELLMKNSKLQDEIFNYYLNLNSNFVLINNSGSVQDSISSICSLIE